MLTDLELMEQHVQVLFRHNEKNQLTVVNEPPYNGAPKVFIGGTKHGYVVRYSNTIEEKLKEKLDRLIEVSPSEKLIELIKVLNQEQEVNSLEFGPVYVFQNNITNVNTEVLQITYDNKELLKNSFPYTYEDFEFKQPCFVKFENERIVSICCSARQTSKGDEASLYTDPDNRGKGYGVEVARAWAKEVQRQGRIALYSTSWDNFASQAVARQLGLIQYGIDITIE